MVVMMNPGGSRPASGKSDYCGVWKAVPDKTQDQIKKVMDEANFNYARVLNLSDKREPKSSEFYKFIDGEEGKSVDHSIFSNKRKVELAKLFNSKAPVILAWGVHRSLKALTKQATEAINNLDGRNPPFCVGWLNEGKKYIHPLVHYEKGKSAEWVEQITSQLNLVFRSSSEKKRINPSYDERWNRRDKGLITCWEVGRKMRDSENRLVKKVERDELPVLGWKGGVSEKLKKSTGRKYGSLNYLAQWQGLKGEDLNISLVKEVTIKCSKTEKEVTFTPHSTKY